MIYSSSWWSLVFEEVVSLNLLRFTTFSSDFRGVLWDWGNNVLEPSQECHCVFYWELELYHA